MAEFHIDIVGRIGNIMNDVDRAVEARAFAASNALRTAIMTKALIGDRHGRTYRLPGGGTYTNPGGTYTASAPGESPAVRTGTLRTHWRAVQYSRGHTNPTIETNVPYARLLETGTSRMKPRPYVEKTIQAAIPELESIYGAPIDINP